MREIDYLTVDKEKWRNELTEEAVRGLLKRSGSQDTGHSASQLRILRIRGKTY